MRIVIAGAGLLGRELTALLLEHDHDVVVVDMDREVCDLLYERTGAVTVNGSATSLSVLRDAGAHRADVLLCLMGSDADNIATAILARSLGVPRILARMRDRAYEQAYHISGVTGIARVTELLLDNLLTEIEQPELRRIMSLGGGAAHVYAVRVPEDADCAGKTVRDVAGGGDLPEESLLMGVYREDTDKFFIPRGDYVLEVGDTVFVTSRERDIKEVARALGVTV